MSGSGQWIGLAGPSRANGRFPGGAAMTVLCLLEMDAAGVADASLRALTFTRGLAGASGASGAAGSSAAGGPSEPVAAVAFTRAGGLPGEVLASYGATEAHVVEPDTLAGYAPVAWARVLA